MASILQGTSRSFPENVSTTEYFQKHLTEFPEVKAKTALIFEQEKISFENLDLTSTRLALAISDLIEEKKLRNQNPDNDWVIALCLPPSEKVVLCIFAIHKLGAAYVPIDNTFPENRVVSMINSCKPVLVISDIVSSTVSKFDVVRGQTEIVTFDDLLARAVKMDVRNIVPLPSQKKSLAERVALVLYTSGSSGAPKGVRLKHSAIMNRLFWQWETFSFGEDEKCCFKTALTFVDSLAEIFGPLLQGFSINIFSKHIVSNPHLLIKNIYAVGITRLVLVPSLLRALLSTLELLRSEDAKGIEKLNSIRLWICSGETLQKDLLDDFFLQFPNGKTLANFYGSTEVMADVTVATFSSSEDVEKQVDGVHVPIGSPVFNTTLYILDEEMKLVPAGEIGELYVAGRNLCSGYVGIDNVDKFIPNPFSSEPGFTTLFKTGDFVRVVSKNGRETLLYEGRSDSQVKVRGQRVDLNEIEAVLNSQSELISRGFVLCYNAGRDDQALIAFVIPTTKEVTAQEILTRAKETLKPYEVPEIKIISEVPLLVNGKVDRQRLLSSFANERHENENSGSEVTFKDFAPELLESARLLVKTIWEVTHVPERNIVENFNDSFFNIGGTSLNSVTVVTKLRAKKFHIGLEDFVSAGSLRQMLPKMTPISCSGSKADRENSENEHFYAEFLTESDVDETSSMIGYSFSMKGDLEVYTNSTFQDFKGFITTLFPVLLEQGLSFIVRRKSNKKAVATALSFDLFDEPEGVVAPPGIKTVLGFLDHLECRQREKLPKGINKIIHSFMMGTHESVAAAENVPLIAFMEQEITRIGRDKGFVGVMTTNTNPLTMQVCSELLGYETLVEYQVNQYETYDGLQPFKMAPDSQVVNCCWKKLETNTFPEFPTA